MESFGVYFSFFPQYNQTLEGTPLKITEVQVQKGPTRSFHPGEQVTDQSNALQRKCSMI